MIFHSPLSYTWVFSCCWLNEPLLPTPILFYVAYIIPQNMSNFEIPEQYICYLLWEILISLTSKHPAGGPIVVSSPRFSVQYIHRSPYMDYLVLIPNYNNSCAKHLHCIKQTLITQALNRHHLTLIKCTNMRIRNSVICNHLITQPTKYKLPRQIN